jgi:tripartite-type tricarboxylate transporter receptor subunit TctC
MDSVGRLFADNLARVWKEGTVVENKPGAGSIVGIAFAAKAPADGYTLLMASSGLGASQFITKDIPFDALKDFAPIARMSESVNYLIVNVNVPARTLEEFIRYAMANPGKLNAGSVGTGLLWTMGFMKQAGISMVNVPYAGGAQMLPALIAGDIQFMIDCGAGCKGQAEAGKLRILAGGGTQRAEQLPNVPTAAESGLPGFEAVSWQGLLAPAGTQKDIIDKLAAAVADWLHTPDTESRLKALNLRPLSSGPSEFRRYLENEIQKYREVAEFGNLKPQ